MNYLAHVYLSPNNPHATIGNLMGDFVKGNKYLEYSFDIQTGILLHRAIDRFTDNHPAVKNLKNFLSQERKRYAGIISDIIFDHLLATNWQSYSEEKIEDFANRHYQIFEQHFTLMPNNMQAMVSRMIERNWLARYACKTTTGLAIDAVSERIRFDNNLKGAMVEVEQNYHQFQAAFDAFFPELKQYSEQQYLLLREQIKTADK